MKHPGGSPSGIPGRRRHRGILPALAALLAALTMGTNTAQAGTAAGSLITNVVIISMDSGFPSYVPYTVTYNSTAEVRIKPPDVMSSYKTASPSMLGSGGVVTFRIWIVGAYSDSSWNVTVTDKLPGNSSFAGNYSVWNGGGTPGTWYPSYSADGTSFTAGQPNNGQTGPYYLRWAHTRLGPLKSAYVEYSLRIL